MGYASTPSGTSERTCNADDNVTFVLDPAVTELLRQIGNGSKGRGRPKVTHPNRMRTHLASFSSPGLALAGLPGLDAIVTGAVNLDLGGNTRPLSKKLVISMLQRLDNIATEAVQKFMHNTLRECSERHAQKVAVCLRIIETAAYNLVATEWPSAADYPVDSCGNPSCSICTGIGAGRFDVDEFAFAVPDFAESD